MTGGLRNVTANRRTRSSLLFFFFYLFHLAVRKRLCRLITTPQETSLDTFKTFPFHFFFLLGGVHIFLFCLLLQLFKPRGWKRTRFSIECFSKKWKRRQIDRKKKRLPSRNSIPKHSCTRAIVDKKRRSTTISLLFFFISTLPRCRDKKWWHTISFIHHAWRQEKRNKSQTETHTHTHKREEGRARNRWWDGDWITSYHHPSEKKRKLDERRTATNYKTE